MLTACSQEWTDEPLNGTVLADFSKGEAETVFASDGWTNEDVFNTFWKDDNVTYENGAMNLSITENPDGSMETNDGYFGGEGRTYQYFGYGDFEVRMKPSGKNGTCSAFFTCTGDYDLDENGDPNPWDEVDIEFLGNDTTQVQFNYYVDGVGGHEKKIDLGFDASEDFHNYGYRWTEDYIVWFVDGKPVYQNLGETGHLVLELLAEEHVRDVNRALEKIACFSAEGPIFCRQARCFCPRTDGKETQYLCSLMKIGPVTLEGVDGEVPTSTGAAIVGVSPEERTVFISHANGYQGYIPDDWQLEHRSFEAEGAPLQPGYSEKRLTETFCTLFAELR